MSTRQQGKSISQLIEGSSLGTARARAARASVPLATGRALAQAAAARGAKRVAASTRTKSQG